MDERTAALEARIATLEKQNAVLEVRVASMQGDFTKAVTLLETLNTEIHAIREMIAFGKGAWWIGLLIIGGLVAVAGGAGAIAHRIMGGQ